VEESSIYTEIIPFIHKVIHMKRVELQSCYYFQLQQQEMKKILCLSHPELLLDYSR